MTALNKYAELREELSNPANGSNHHLRKLALSLLDDLETKEAQRANWFQMAHKLGEDLDVAEKRIAELEARTVTLPDEPFYPDGDIDCPLSVNLVDIKTACDEAGVPLVVRCGK
ncbi:hypothetical protein [Citrobacter freundii]|uniref:hypothetical protein n=1 Tax=Citrobacter freundii TaxID=546 RepID=UPI001F295892|nr:hypothetical protein [Citrobacter freundii]